MSSKSNSCYWEKEVVMDYLVQAADIHRRLPAVRPPGYVSCWPDIVREDWERLYDLANGRERQGAPMPPEVTFHEAVMEWLRLLDRGEQKLVMMRASGIPWKTVAMDLSGARSSLWRNLDKHLRTIAAHLNRADPQGEHFRRLRSRALCEAPK